MKKKFPRWALVILTVVCILVVFALPKPSGDGWQKNGNRIRYLLDGQPVTGWQEIDGSNYYFNEEGTLCTGWTEVSGDVFYFGTDGRLTTGWLELDGLRYYLGSSGARLRGWQTIDGNQYFFEDDGHMCTGIMIEEGSAYLFNAEGRLSTGWVRLGEKLYYADESGHPLYGWTEIDGKVHYFDETGAAASGWVTLDGFSYYFLTDGAPAQGKQIIDGKAHYFAPNGQILYLVNPWNYIPEDYTVELVSIGDTHQVASYAYDDYFQMIADCQAAGFSPAVCSSYRTQEYQEGLFQNRIDRYVNQGYSEEEATELAGHSVAIPGTSEHQLGLALDIVENNFWHLDERQAKRPTQIWLMENSWRYGWILRYPVDKSEITGIIYEPWHYRYVGKDIAAQMHDLDLCLEEYLEMLTNSVG